MFLISVIALTASVSGQYDNADISCFHCHSRQVKEFQNSVHYNKNVCTDCHGGDINISGAAVSTGAMHTNFTGAPGRVEVISFCSKCHPEVTWTYEKSIHWQKLREGRSDAASCIDCHGTHNILSSSNPNSSTYLQNVPVTCADCHENQTRMQALYYGIKTDRFDTYKRSYHYKAYESGGRLLAACSDCHENHDTRTGDDPASAIYQANLPSTCGKNDCHPGARNAYIYGGKVHEDQSIYLLSIDFKKLVTYFYIAMILFELTFTFGLIFLGISSNYELRRRN